MHVAHFMCIKTSFGII